MNHVKKDFPIFDKNPGLVYLDSTASSLKPQVVIDAMNSYYTEYSANVYRGIYDISERATEAFENARSIVADFIHAPSKNEVIFTRNATESLNLIAYSLGRSLQDKGGEIITTVMEHHANFVPWQQLAFENGLDFKVIDVDDEGYLHSLKAADFANGNPLKGIVTERTRIIAFTHVSNVLGTINPVKELTAAAKELNPRVIVVIDGAQAVSHLQVDVSDIGCDFYAFSGHKMLGPTGVGVLWGKEILLNEMPPFLFGGEMIQSVSLERTTFKNAPTKFEAGTPAIAECIGLGQAITYLKKIGMDTIRDHEIELTEYAFAQFEKEFGKNISVIGPSTVSDRVGILSFSFNDFHGHDIAQILNESHIAVRAGHHCAQPLHTRYNLVSTARASFYLYTTNDDVDALVEGLKKVEKKLK